LKSLGNVIVIDASVLIEMLYDTKIGRKAKKLLENSTTYTTELAITETYYILCKELGSEEARDRINSLLDSGYIDVLSVEPDKVGDIKCERTISLADSYVLALAEKINAVAVFARREKENN